MSSFSDGNNMNINIQELLKNKVESDKKTVNNFSANKDEEKNNTFQKNIKLFENKII